MSFDTIKNAGLGALVMLVVAVAGAATYQSHEALQALGVDASRNDRLRSAIVAARFELQVARDVLRVAQAGGRVGENEIGAAIDRALAHLRECPECSAALAAEEGREDLQQAAVALSRLRELVVAMPSGRPSESVFEAFADSELWLDQVARHLGSRLDKRQAAVLAATRRQHRMFVMLAALTLVLAVAISLALSRTLGARLKPLSEGARHLARGDIDFRIPVTGDDDLAAVARQFNKMAATLGEQRHNLSRIAYFDIVTGLPNGALLRRHLERLLDARTRLALLYVDLDGFRVINEARGRDFGDRLLAAIAPRLRDCTRGTPSLLQSWHPGAEPGHPGDLVARLGGDVFVLLLAPLAHAGEATAAARRVSAALADPIDIDGEGLYLSATVGTVIAPEHGTDADALLRNAVAAVHHARMRGHGRRELFRPAIAERARSRHERLNGLRAALDHGDFELHYQPRIALATDTPAGAEALVRWRGPDGELIPPGEFIPLAEESGLIGPLGEWVLEAVCDQLADWRRGELAPLPIAVNLCATQFQSRRLVGSLRAALDRHGLAPGDLEIEVTERAVMEDTNVSRRMFGDLAALGIRVSLDDFGTGYSSLSELKHLPIAMLKIDRSFVRGVPDDTRDAAIVSSVIELAHEFGLGVVGEGVETRTQLDFLRARGCDEVQGFLLCRPLPAAEFATWLGAHGRPALRAVDRPRRA